MLWAASSEDKGVEWMELAVPGRGIERHGFNSAAISASIILGAPQHSRWIGVALSWCVESTKQVATTVHF
jgi:hypothetical protein